MKIKNMIKNKNRLSAIVFVLVFAMFMNYIGVLPFYASGNNDINITASTSASVKQGNSGYCYVYVDSLESLSSLSVTVHFDPQKISVSSLYVYNSIPCTLYDKAVGEADVKFSYIFDGNGEAGKKQLFYFRYTVLSDAEVGDTYFDIVVNEAYDSSVEPVSVRGSRCSFSITETVMTKTCSIYSSSSISTSVGEEFELSYRLSDYQISSGSFVINYDPELFEVVDVSNGTFLDNKTVDVNTNLSGAVYVSFAGTEYNSNTNLLTVRFKTLHNVAEISTIKFTSMEFYDVELNPISCNGYTAKATVVFDETYTEDAPNMALQAIYDVETDKVTLTIGLDKDSMLGAGDFVLTFDTTYLTCISAEKGFSPTFFNINDKNVADGILRFSIISLSDITDEHTVLTVVFDVKHDCEDKTLDFEISGSGIADSLTKPISLNLIDTSVTIPLRHIEAIAVVENKIEPNCTTDGSYDTVIYCSVCKEELSRETTIVDKLGHTASRYNWDKNDHWSVCKCGATVENSKEDHRFGEDGTAKICSDCSYERILGYTVSGTITSYLEGEGNIIVQLLTSDGNVAYSTVVNTYSGTYAFTSTYSISEVADGTYTLRVSKANHVTRDYEVKVFGGDFTQDVKIHLIGDITGDGNVNIIDVNKANLYYKKNVPLSVYEFQCAEVTGDDNVDFFDVNKINLHYKNQSKLW